MVRGSSADQCSANRRLSASFIARGRTQITPRDRIQISKISSLQSHRRMGVMKQDCTTRFENAHRIVLREVLYRHHPWFGRRVCIHGAVDKDGFVVFRCTLEESQADRWLEVPAWMFDRTACPDPGLLAAQPYVSIETLAALSALLSLALKDQTPSAFLLSGASRVSHDQNRGEAHVTRDGNAKEGVPTQSTIAA